MQIFQFNANGIFGLTISKYPLATRMTLTSEKDLRISSRVVVVKVKTFCDEFTATLCSTAWWGGGGGVREEAKLFKGRGAVVRC